MHRNSSPNLARRSTERGFSLPEIAISLAVLSIAFVSLFALLPYGLTSFRASIDTANETWIMQGLNSMVQTTEWEKLWGPTATLDKEIYYFDEEGRLTDTESNPSSLDKVRAARLYQAKLFFFPLYRPALTSSNDTFVALDTAGGNSDPTAVRVIAVMANRTNPKASAKFKALQTASQIENLPKDSGLIVRSFVVAKMNSIY